MESEIMVALCNVQWFFFLFHQIFFALVPGLMLRYEMILENPQSGVLYLRQISEQSWNKIKVSKSRKQFMVSSILPKNERNALRIHIEEAIICFRYCLTFDVNLIMYEI